MGTRVNPAGRPVPDPGRAAEPCESPAVGDAVTSDVDPPGYHPPGGRSESLGDDSPLSCWAVTCTGECNG